MSSKSLVDDDVAIIFSLLSSIIPLLASVIFQTKLIEIMSYLERRLRDRRIPRCALVDAGQSSFQRLYIVTLLERPGFYILHWPGLFFIPVCAKQVFTIIQSIIPLF